WFERGTMSLEDIIEVIDGLATGKTASVKRTDWEISAEAHSVSHMQKIRQSIKERGLIGGIVHIWGRACRRITRYFYETDRNLILLLDLNEYTTPSYPAPADITFEELKSPEAEALLELWPAAIQHKKIEKVKRRLENGYKCYIARFDGAIAAIDWVTNTEDYEPYTGLTIRLKPGSCYGLDLHENPKYMNQGIGLATLAYSINKSRESGFLRQITIVSEKNLKMLQTAIQLFGFRKIGQIETKRIFRMTRSTWQVDNVKSREKEVLI
ncbi:MAG: hypothetical protein AB1746_12870, partial [Candidatus Zixiibacteriota bacterium]